MSPIKAPLSPERQACSLLSQRGDSSDSEEAANNSEEDDDVDPEDMAAYPRAGIAVGPILDAN